MLPHAVHAPKQRRYYPYSSSGGAAVGGSGSPSGASGVPVIYQTSDLFGTSRLVLLILLTAVPSFFLGTTVTLYAGVDCTAHAPTDPSSSTTSSSSSSTTTTTTRTTTESGSSSASLEQQSQPGFQSLVNTRVRELLAEKEEELVKTQTELVRKLVQKGLAEEREKQGCSGNGGGGDKPVLDENRVGNMVYGMAYTPKENFTQLFDLGVPLDKVKRGSSDVLVLYSRNRALPVPVPRGQTGPKNIVAMSAEDATKHCDYLNILMLDHSKSRNQCLALVPQYESYHLQHWMRVPEHASHHARKLNSSEPLRLVSRALTGAGREEFPPPKKFETNKLFEILKTYINSMDTVLDEVNTILKRIATKSKAVIVMVCNFGQSELLMNFVCQAKAKNLDISPIILFATDEETYKLALSLGLSAYFDEKNYGHIPEEAARTYGDKRFEAMMLAKVVCVQMVNYLGYDLLFQDVDMIWYKNPLDYFSKSSWTAKYDMFFQDDGGHSIRYAPYSANSGFYFVRHNDKTRSFLTGLLLQGDMIIETDSHQQVMIALMNEYVSLYGMKVKVLHRDEPDLPGGYQWNMKSGNYMRALFKGEIKPWIFHMSWTLNKDNKVKYLQQMGQWYVPGKCIQAKKDEILRDNPADSVARVCCTAEPLFQCHYRDKPSIKPCRDSPNIDQGKKSFW